MQRHHCVFADALGMLTFKQFSQSQLTFKATNEGVQQSQPCSSRRIAAMTAAAWKAHGTRHGKSRTVQTGTTFSFLFSSLFRALSLSLTLLSILRLPRLYAWIGKRAVVLLTCWALVCWLCCMLSTGRRPSSLFPCFPCVQPAPGEAHTHTPYNKYPQILCLVQNYSIKWNLKCQ